MSLNELLFELGRYAGLLAYFSLALLIFSGDTARYFDRFFGLDRIIKFQRKFSLLLLVFVISHPLLFIIASGQIANFLIPDFSLLALASGIIAFYLLLVFFLASQLYKRISNRVWQYLHLLSYLFFFFAAFHALNWGSDASATWFKITLYSSLLAISVAIIYRTYRKLRDRGQTLATVVTNTPATHDSFTLRLRPKKKMDFRAGQFAFLRLDRDKLFARHPFTIANAPGEDELEFTIKDTGRFTAAARQLQAGDEINIEGPYGRFFLRDQDKDIIMIAGGVGITPFLSITREALKRNNKQRLVLLYGAMSLADIIAKEYLDTLPSRGLERAYFLSQEKGTGDYFPGRLNIKALKRFIRNQDQTLFYICGPKAMKDDIKKSLRALGVRNKDIIIEDFFW
jgi:predicted ferric reductase